jgi:type IV secretion system protein TrbJ
MHWRLSRKRRNRKREPDRRNRLVCAVPLAAVAEDRRAAFPPATRGLAAMRALARAAAVPVLCIACASPRPAHAQAAVTCVNCSTIVEQLLQYAQQLNQLAQETATEINTLNILTQEIINTEKLPETLVQDATADIRQITGIASAASLTIGNTGNFIANLGASSYPAGILNNPMQEIVNEQNAISNAVKALGNVLNVENPNLGNNASILVALNNQSMTSAGRMQALQAAQGVGMTTGQQLQSLETVVLAMAQAAHATGLAQADRRAMEDKQMDLWSPASNYPTSGYQNF